MDVAAALKRKREQDRDEQALARLEYKYNEAQRAFAQATRELESGRRAYRQRYGGKS